jgi:prephenate dehydratase
VAFQGERGAYSEQALREHFGNQFEPLNRPHLEDVFDAVENAEAEYCIVPVENSSAGSIYRTYDLLTERSLHIIDEHYVKINHCFLVIPGTPLSNIKEVFSHSQALDQSHAYLQKISVRERPFYDTAGAAAWVSEQENPAYAAIASALAASHYGLEIMAEGIQTYGHNTTRFLILSKSPTTPKGECKTSIEFESKHIPAALYKCLGGFATNGINLTKLESRPSQTGMGRYRFYLDCEGHIDEPDVDRALRELQFFTSSYRILGSYSRGKLPE